MRKLAVVALLLAELSDGQAQHDGRVTVKNAVFSSTIPAGPEWRQIGSAYLSTTYQRQDAETSRTWNIRLAGAQIKPVTTRDDLIREFFDMSKGMVTQPGFEVGSMEVLPAKARRYDCVEGMTRPSPATAMPMTLKFKVAFCRHPIYANGGVLLAMSVSFKTGDDAQLDGFDRLVDDLVMH